MCRVDCQTTSSQCINVRLTGPCHPSRSPRSIYSQWDTNRVCLRQLSSSAHIERLKAFSETRRKVGINVDDVSPELLEQRMTSHQGEEKKETRDLSLSLSLCSIFRFSRHCWEPVAVRWYGTLGTLGYRETRKLGTSKLSASFAKIKATLCRTGSNSQPRCTAGRGTFALSIRSRVFRIFLRRLSLRKQRE